MKANIESFFDQQTFTITHVIYDKTGGTAAVIDPVWDFDQKSGRTNTSNAERVIEFIRANQLKLAWILETHAHADHLSAAQFIKAHLDGKIAIGSNIGKVQIAFKRLFNLEPTFPVDGSQFDHLFDDGETFNIGELSAKVIAVPGHTTADIAYQIEDIVFIGDTMFMPDTGTARCDFPGGDARALYRSIKRILSLPNATLLYLCHDYPPEERSPQWISTVADQRAGNIHVHDGISEEAFVALRTQRDATLEMPTLLMPSVQVNIRAGLLPPVESNGQHYLKIPIDMV